MIGRLDKRRSEQPCTVTNAAVGTSNPPAAGSNPAGRAECLVGYRGSPRRVPAPVRIRALPVHLLLVDKGVPKRPQVVLIVVSCSSAVRSRARCLGKEVAGLNDAQIPSALKDFQALDAIPVSFEALDPSPTHRTFKVSSPARWRPLLAPTSGAKPTTGTSGENYWRGSRSTGSSAAPAPR